VDIVKTNQETVECKVLTENGQTLKDGSELCGTEPTEGTVCGTDR
jgi:hypothetical protein